MFMTGTVPGNDCDALMQVRQVQCALEVDRRNDKPAEVPAEAPAYLTQCQFYCLRQPSKTLESTFISSRAAPWEGHLLSSLAFYIDMQTSLLRPIHVVFSDVRSLGPQLVSDSAIRLIRRLT